MFIIICRGKSQLCSMCARGHPVIKGIVFIRCVAGYGAIAYILINIMYALFLTVSQTLAKGLQVGMKLPGGRKGLEM